MKDRDSEAAGCDSFFVGKLVAQEGEEDVPEDDGCKTAVSKEEAGQSTQEEDVLHLVVPPGKGLELECQHGNLCYQEEAEKQHEEEEEDCVEAQGCEERMLPKYEGANVKKGVVPEVDGVTGATFTSDAMKENIRRAVDYYFKHK